MLSAFCLLYRLALATYEDAADIVVRGSALSDLLKHYTSEKLQKLLMDSADDLIEL